MRAQRCRSYPATKRSIVGAALAASFAVLATVVGAVELPSFRKGMWEFTRTVDNGSEKAQTFQNKKCADPTADMKKQNATLAKAGCKSSALTKSGSSYSFTSQCNIRGVATQSTSVIAVSGDSGYRLTVESRASGKTSREVLTARRIGGC